MARKQKAHYRVYTMDDYSSSLHAKAEYEFEEDGTVTALAAVERYANSFPDRTPDGTTVFVQRINRDMWEPLYPYRIERGLKVRPA